LRGTGLVRGAGGGTRHVTVRGSPGGAHQHLARFTGAEGVLFVGRAQEKSVIGDAADVAYWRARAERAEGQVAELEVRVAELSEQVAVLSRMLFGRSSEKTNPVPDQGAEAEEPDRLDARGPRDRDEPERKRGQRPGSKGMAGGTTRIWIPGRRSMMCPPTGGCAPAAGWSSSSWVLRPVSRSTGR
jgi:hypothetical protein